LIENELIDFIRTEIANDLTATLGPDDPLLDGALDSIDALKLVVFVEERYSIRFDDDDLVPQNFDTITTLADLVRDKSMSANQTIPAS
jgi:acyl carrier protein